jgi:hypothetical protein
MAYRVLNREDDTDDIEPNAFGGKTGAPDVLGGGAHQTSALFSIHGLFGTAVHFAGAGFNFHEY